jgi:hypothetical protein
VNRQVTDGITLDASIINTSTLNSNNTVTAELDSIEVQNGVGSVDDEVGGVVDEAKSLAPQSGVEFVQNPLF